MHDDNQLPLVSVCIPLYNHSRFVTECIESVAGQDYENIEVILIDDGSKDGSYDIAKKSLFMCEKRFKRVNFIQRENRGVCSTLNEALDWSQGRFFSAIASDDVWFPNKIACQVQYLKKNESAAAVFGGVLIIDEHSKETKRIPGADKKYTFEDIFLTQYNIFAVTGLMRIDDLRKTGGYHKDRKLEDFYMWLKLTESFEKTLDVFRKIVAKYRIHSNNITKSYKSLHVDRVKIIEEFKNHPLYECALDAAFLEASSSAVRYNRLDAILYFLKARFRFHKKYLRGLMKIIIPKYFFK